MSGWVAGVHGWVVGWVGGMGRCVGGGGGVGQGLLAPRGGWGNG